MTALSLAPSFNALALQLAEALRAHFARQVAREELDKLSDAALADLGLTRPTVAGALDRELRRIERLTLGR